MDFKDITKEDVIKQIDYYIKNIQTAQIDVMFVRKTQSQTNKYSTLMFDCEEKDIEKMASETLNNMKTYLDEKNFDNYDLLVSLDDVIQVIEEKRVVNHSKIINQITIDYTDENTINEQINFSKFNFLVLKISSSEEGINPIICYKRHYKSPAKFKNATSYTFNGKIPKVFDKDLLIIGANVDAICVGEFFYIVNRDHFNTMLDFKDVYKNIIDSNKEKIDKCEVFEKTEQFIDDCKEHGQYVARLTKAILGKGFENLEKNKSKLTEIVSSHGLKLQLNEDGKILYNKENTGEILNILLEHYVTSDLTSKRMLAKAIEKYE